MGAVALFNSLFIALLLTSWTALGQTAAKPTGQPVLPTIFLLGEFEKQYEEIMPGYQSLLEAHNNNMETAYASLVGMMQEMEAFAFISGYDLKGINAWMHFFWREDGTVEHIGFFLKPNSKNVNTDELKGFLSAFAKQYKFPLLATQKYSHYSSFAFPIAVQTPAPPAGDKSTAKKSSKGNQR